MVPTVDLGFFMTVFCSIEMTGERPFTKSTSGFLSWETNWRAKVESDSMKRRCPSAYTVSKAREDFPEPLTPVTTTSLSRGISRWTFRRLFSRAPLTSMVDLILISLSSQIFDLQQLNSVFVVIIRRLFNFDSAFLGQVDGV